MYTLGVTLWCNGNESTDAERDSNGGLQGHYRGVIIMVAVPSTRALSTVCTIYSYHGLWCSMPVARDRNLDDDELMKEPKRATNLLL